MKRARTRFVSFVITAAMVLGMIPAMALPVFFSPAKKEVRAAGPVYTHDGDEIRALLESDGDVYIELDGNVHWSTDVMDDRPVVDMPYPDAYHSDIVKKQVWATIGSGEKKIDLNGHSFKVGVDDPPYDRKITMLYLFEIPAGASMTVDDSSGKNSEIFFDGYMHSASSGPAGTHRANYRNNSVQYRNVFLVTGGGLTFNGGEIATRKKLQYVSPARPWNSVTGSGISKKISQQINCVGISLMSGNVEINGGIIAGRGYRFMYAGSYDEGLYYASEFWPASGLWAKSGTLVINDGTFNGLGGANAIYVIPDDVNTKIRSGSFNTRTVDEYLVPTADDAGSTSATDCPRYADGSYGINGVFWNFLDENISEVYHDGKKIDKEDWNDYLFKNKDIDIRPNQHAPINLIDPRDNKAVEREVVWDGTTDLVLTAKLDNSFPDYPWRDNYYSALVQSGKVMGVSSKVIVGGEVHHAGGETVGADVVIEYSKEDLSSGVLKVNLKDLRPADMGTKRTFSVDICYEENLMPYNMKNKRSGSVVHKKTIIVTIDDTDINVKTQPSNVWGQEGQTEATLTAVGHNATKAWWVQDWPNTLVNLESESTFDPATGVATLTVPIESNACYYHCVFANDYKSAMSNVVCVRKAFDIQNQNVDLTDPSTYETVDLYTMNGYENLFSSEKDFELYRAYDATRGSERALRWYFSNSPSAQGQVIAEERTSQPVDGVDYEYVLPGGMTLHIIGDGTKAGHGTGWYHAEIDLVINGEKKTFTSRYYYATESGAVPPNGITEVHIGGLADLYLGGPKPTIDDLWVESGYYKIKSFTWTVGPSGDTFTMPHVVYDLVIELTDKAIDQGYTFVYIGGKIPVYMEGALWGSAETGPFSYEKEVRFHYAYDQYHPLESRTGNTPVQADIPIGDGEDRKSLLPNLKASTIYSPYGQMFQSSAQISAYSTTALPEGLTVDEDGVISGVLPKDTPLGLKTFEYSYKNSSAGTSPFSAYSNYVAVKRLLADMQLPEDTKTLDHEHAFGGCTDNGDGTHSHVCSSCGAVETSAHCWDDGEVTKEATKDSEGVLTYTCEDCGATKTQAIPYETHSELTYVPEVLPTCETEGSKGYYVCEHCGLHFSDAEGENEITDAELKIPALAHEFGEWTITRDATPEVPGEEQRVCKHDATHIEKRATYILSFDLGGGTINGKSTITMQAGIGSVITLPEAPVRPGYKFVYWKGSYYKPGESYTVVDYHTFTAVWEKVQDDVTTPAKTVVVNRRVPKTGDIGYDTDKRTLIGISLIGLSAVILIRIRRRDDAKNDAI